MELTTTFFIKPAKLARFLRIEDGGVNDQSLYFQNQYQGVTINIGGTTSQNSPVSPQDLMLFKVRKGADVMLLVDGSGKMGIGTETPTEKLDVDGQIRMRGGAISGYIPVSDADGSLIASLAPVAVRQGPFHQYHSSAQNDYIYTLFLTGDWGGQKKLLDHFNKTGIYTRPISSRHQSPCQRQQCTGQQNTGEAV